MAPKQKLPTLKQLAEKVETLGTHHDKLHDDSVDIEERVYALEHPQPEPAPLVPEGEDLDSNDLFVDFEEAEFGWMEFGLGVIIGGVITGAIAGLIALLR